MTELSFDILQALVGVGVGAVFFSGVLVRKLWASKGGPK